MQAQEIQDVNRDLIASPSLLNGDWKRSCRDMARLKDDSVIKFASQPWIMSVDRKRYDSYSDSLIHSMLLIKAGEGILLRIMRQRNLQREILIKSKSAVEPQWLLIM